MAHSWSGLTKNKLQEVSGFEMLDISHPGVPSNVGHIPVWHAGVLEMFGTYTILLVPGYTLCQGYILGLS